MLCNSGFKALTLVSQMQAMLCSNVAYRLTMFVFNLLYYADYPCIYEAPHHPFA